MKTALTKRKICLIQLEQSLRLLDEGDSVSALTLAGAAEEILGRIAKRKGHEPRVVSEADYLASVADYFGKPRPPRKHVIAALNKRRNELKHQDDGRNAALTQIGNSRQNACSYAPCSITSMHSDVILLSNRSVTGSRT